MQSGPLQALLVAVCLGAAAMAYAVDVVRFADGRDAPAATVESIRVRADGAVLHVRPEGRENTFPIVLADLSEVRLAGAEPGRPARLQMADGRVFDEVLVVGFVLEEDEPPAILVRQQEDPVDIDPHRVDLDRLARVDFEPPPEGAEVPADIPTPTATPTRTPITPVPHDEFDSPGIHLFVPNPALLTGDDYEEGSQFFSDRSLDWGGGQGGEGFRMPQIPGLPGFLTTNLVVPFINAGINLLGFLVYLVIGASVGGLFLHITAKVENVSDFPPWKAFVTAGALAVFPPGLFLLCARFIPFLGCAIGLIVFYFATRAIIMGAMEILEEKASSVLWTYIMIQVVALMSVVFGLSWIVETFVLS